MVSSGLEAAGWRERAVSEFCAGPEMVRGGGGIILSCCLFTGTTNRPPGNTNMYV